MKPRVHTVAGGGGLELHVRDFGPQEARPILFLHGWSQMHLCWLKQIESPLAGEFRLICPDLRGHGASAKPLTPDAYESALWAEDVAAVIETLALERPIIVAWSMAGWVLGDYLRHQGEARIGGVVMVGAIYRGGALADAEILAAIKPDASGAALLSADQAKALQGMVSFVKACFGGVLGKRDMALIAGWTMLCPVEVRRACIKRDVDFSAEYAALGRPVRIIQGKADRVVPEATAEALSALIPGAALSLYPGIGHLPFWEDAERFNTELAEFARAA